ncbi:MAG: hypothetical protein CMH50_03525 [Myxococcales bacterium]|nr:hypothetical protein [Myxococcales bacterium]
MHGDWYAAAYLPLARLSLLIGLISCQEPSVLREVRLEKGQVAFKPLAQPVEPRMFKACYDGAVCLSEVSLSSTSIDPGREVTLQITWFVRREPGKDWRVFLHGSRNRKTAHRFSEDHDPLAGRYPTRDWKAGDLIFEQRQLRVPPQTPPGSYELWGGLYRGDERLQPSQGTRDGQGRALWGVLTVEGQVEPLPQAFVRRVNQPLVVDGKLDEPAWQEAATLGPFDHYDGNGHGRYRTTAKVLWDDQALYLAFHCPDPDIHSPYTERDDPIYESEAVEIFLDPDGDRDAYVELQVAPTGVQFDASFKGGARQGMNTGWNHPYEAKVHVDGTLNRSADQDVAWTAEWRIPFAGLEASPKPGDRWKANLFRLDRVRRQDGRIEHTDATAWSAPLSGDFHQLDRFGELVFQAAVSPKPSPGRPEPPGVP